MEDGQPMVPPPDAEVQYRIDDIYQPGQNVEAPTRYWGPEPHMRNDSRSAEQLRRDFAALLGCPNRHGFLGAQPVSFARRSLEELRREDYFVCEKSDGCRYLLWATVDDQGDECHYLIDRKNQYWHVKRFGLHFPLSEQDPKSFHADSVFDGELVMDHEVDGTLTPRFLVFDCLVLGRTRLMERTLDKRLAYFQERVDKPYRALLRMHPSEVPFLAFLVEPKKMEFSYGVPVLFQQIPKLRHGNDGLIFTCRTSPYVFGTDRHILKWKPPHENTIDFRMSLQFAAARDEETGETYHDYDSVPQSIELTAHRGNNQPPERYGQLYVTADEWETLKGLGDPLNDRVVECFKDDEGRWRLHRFRDDKPEANHVSTVAKVLDSIDDGVSEQELVDAHDSIKRAWKERAEAAQRAMRR